MPAITQCPNVDDLERLAIGVIGDEAAEPIERHLLECPSCVERVAGIQANDTLLDALRAQSTVKDDPAEQSDEFHRLVLRLGELSPPTLSSQLDATSGVQPVGNAEMASVVPVSFAFVAAAQSPDEIGRLGGYRVLRVLGAGGMGVVFEAEDPRLKRRVALKVMKPELAAHAQSRHRFLREAQAMAALDHDHVVTVHQVGEDAGVPFVAMQLLQGESLAERLNRVQGSGRFCRERPPWRSAGGGKQRTGRPGKAILRECSAPGRRNAAHRPRSG
jgi:hypothetical protein